MADDSKFWFMTEVKSESPQEVLKSYTDRMTRELRLLVEKGEIKAMDKPAELLDMLKDGATVLIESVGENHDLSLSLDDGSPIPVGLSADVAELLASIFSDDEFIIMRAAHAAEMEETLDRVADTAYSADPEGRREFEAITEGVRNYFHDKTGGKTRKS